MRERQLINRYALPTATRSAFITKIKTQAHALQLPILGMGPLPAAEHGAMVAATAMHRRDQHPVHAWLGGIAGSHHHPNPPAVGRHQIHLNGLLAHRIQRKPAFLGNGHRPGGKGAARIPAAAEVRQLMQGKQIPVRGRQMIRT